MKRKLFAFAVLSFAIFLLGSKYSFGQDIKIKVPKAGLLAEVDSIVRHKMDQYAIPGLSIGVIKNDSIILSKGYGLRSIKGKDLVTEKSIFHTASISKLLTAVAVMRLVEGNNLSLDDKLVKILPDLNYTDKRVEDITIKNLLNHTSGLPDIHNYHWGNNNQSDNSLKEYIRGLDLKLKTEPSSEYYYSNLAFDILGYVIEKASGTTFDDYMKENILAESEMQTSDFRYFKIPDSLKTNPHSKRMVTGRTYQRKTYPYTREHAPSSTLNSSSLELSKWMISFLQTIDDSQPSHINSRMIEPTFSPNPYIGLGFQLSSIESKKTIGHYGGDKGFRSYLVMIPEEEIGLVLLANCDYDEDFRQEILHPIAKLMLTKYRID